MDGHGSFLKEVLPIYPILDCVLGSWCCDPFGGSMAEVLDGMLSVGRIRFIGHPYGFKGEDSAKYSDLLGILLQGSQCLGFDLRGF